MRTSKVYLFITCYSKRVGHHHLCLGETPRQARDWERFTTGKKKKKEKVFGMEDFGMGKWREANEKQSSL